MLRTNLQASSTEELLSNYHATNRSGSVVSRTEERAFQPAESCNILKQYSGRRSNHGTIHKTRRGRRRSGAVLI
jgi:hypothetical protein